MVATTTADACVRINNSNNLNKDRQHKLDPVVQNTDNTVATTSISVSLIDAEVTQDVDKDNEYSETDVPTWARKRWLYVAILCMAIIAHAISTTVIFPFASFMVCLFVYSNFC